MFFKGSLNDGITKALQEQKLVACFVTDEQAESSAWESWLKDDQDLSITISASAVVLRFVAGSEEAGYLAAFCPLEKTPAFIVIRQGMTIAHLKPGLTQEEFRDGIRDAMGGDGPSNTAQEVVGSHRPDTTNIISDTIQTISAPSAIGSDIRAPSEQATTSLSAKSDAVQDDKVKRAAEIKKIQSDAMTERRRVLTQIENDKKERQLREQERKKSIRVSEKQEAKDIKQAEISARRNHKECALKLRTFDGSTISSTFSSDNTLREHVRSWIDSTLGTLEAPYEFKQVLAPMPNRRISASEEEETLQAIGLAPNALLVMVPIQGYSTAYTGSSPGIISSGISYGYSIVSGGLGMAGNLVGSLIGGRSEPIRAESETQATQSSKPANVRVRTLADQRRGLDDQQLYNGNQVSSISTHLKLIADKVQQLNFERRKDDEDDA